MAASKIGELVVRIGVEDFGTNTEEESIVKRFNQFHDNNLRRLVDASAARCSGFY